MLQLKPIRTATLDLLKVIDSLLARPERTANVRKLLFGVGLPLDIIVYTPLELEKSKVDKYSFIHEILNTGKTLYEFNYNQIIDE